MKALISICAIIFLIPSAVLGQSKNSSSNRILDVGDIPICNTSGDQTSPAVASDGHGGFIVAWQDNRDGVSKIYAQRIDGHGTPLWDQGGRRVCLDTTIQLLPRIVSDGVGGAIIEWQTDGLAPVVGPYGPTFEEYTRDYSAQRISCEGERKWGSNGTVILWVHKTYNPGSTSNFSRKKVDDIVTDGKGGVIALLYEYQWSSTTSGDAYCLERIDSSGVVAWTGAGVGGGSHPFTVHNGRIVSDSLGGAYVSWLYVFQRVYPSTLNFNQVWIAHVDSLGSLLWKKLPVIDGSQSTVFDYGIADDRKGGCYVTWAGASPNGVAADAERDVFAQRFDYGGNLHWGQNGLLVCDAAGVQDEPTAAPGPAGSAIIAWRDFRNGSIAEIYAARITDSGVLTWASGGVRVNRATQVSESDFSLVTHFTDTSGVDVSIPYSPSMNSYQETGKLSVSLWYKPGSSVNSHRSLLFGKSEGNCKDDFIWSFSTADSALSNLSLRNMRSCAGDQYATFSSGGYSNTGLTVGQWNHLELDWDLTGGHVTMYVNGGYIGSQYGFTMPTANEIPSHLIAFLDGAIRDVHLSNTIRHTGEFSPTHETPDNSTIGFWNCDEGAGTTIHDSGPNGNTGFVVGSEYTWAKDAPSYGPDISHSQVICGMCRDRLGNTILLWKTNSVVGQKLDSSGALMWPASGRSIGVGMSGQDQIALSNNNPGDPFIAWQEYNNSTKLDIYGQWVDAPTGNETGNASVLVQNVPGYGIVGKNVHVSLFDKSNRFLDGQNADSAGVAYLTGIPADTGYSIQVNYVATSPSKIYGNEYWGRIGGISVSGSDATAITVTRNAPYTSNIKIRNGNTKEIISGSVPSGTPLLVSIEITNPNEPGSVPQSVQCILTLDRDKQTVYDFVGLSAAHSMPVGTKDTFDFAFTPTGAGSYYHVAAAQVKLNGGDVLSEGGQWGSLSTFTVDPPPPSTVLVTIRSNPQVCTFIVDDSTYAGVKSFVWTSGSIHSLGTTTPQSPQPGTTHKWTHWSDSDSVSHSIMTPDSNVTYTVSFDTSFYLTTNAGTGGSVEPPSGWFKSGSVVAISATPNQGWRFSQWIGVGKGSYGGTDAAATILMDSVILETAAFEPATGISDLNLGIPTTFVLSGNYPNPFNPSTTIRFGVPIRSSVRVTVYSMIGEIVAELADEEVGAGYHEVKFDGSRLSSGAYIYRLQAGGFVQSRKLLLVK